MCVHVSAAHKPEALAKGHGILRLRFRLVCCIIPHGYLEQGAKRQECRKVSTSRAPRRARTCSGHDQTGPHPTWQAFPFDPALPTGWPSDPGAVYSTNVGRRVGAAVPGSMLMVPVPVVGPPPIF